MSKSHFCMSITMPQHHPYGELVYLIVPILMLCWLLTKHRRIRLVALCACNAQAAVWVQSLNGALHLHALKHSLFDSAVQYFTV